MDGGGHAPADGGAAHAPAADGPAPVTADVRHANHHTQGTGPHHNEKSSSQERLTPRPTFLENLANSRDSQFMLSQHDSDDLDRYFHGPRDLDKHSKWPIMLRMHGSIMPKLILPIACVAGWSTLITLISHFVHDLSVDNILLTVLGFVVGLSLSFRSSTAYERWADGRKYWSLLIQTSRNMSRTIWVNTSEREGEQGKEDLLRKLTAINLILAFAVSLKHKLRFEPDVGYDDLAGLVGYLDTFAKDAHDRQVILPRKRTIWKAAGEYLGVSFAESNPRKLIKRSKKPLGHLPLEVLNHISAYIDSVIENGTLSISLHQSQAITYIAQLNEVVTGTERVLDTPLPAAYSIAIAQIAWIYVLVLPFQLYNSLGWVTIPGSIVAAYIILGLATIGSEIENPFGHDVNDLPLDTYCRQIALELDTVTAAPAPKVADFCSREDNYVLYPLSTSGQPAWKDRSVEDIRAALRAKVIANCSPGSASNASTIVQEVTAKLNKQPLV
ncbi:Bestrophin, RFP-TM, chloride channel-domain-containing protein [Aspergillus cavernicola]|uniref:Bestrophin, RFP-TM, chloride channel-domain-containing protein n=1 Tax=Aspergillus cavernicola TaxID=176166 RepID=A0ABR4IFF8_9EURO